MKMWKNKIESFFKNEQLKEGFVEGEEGVVVSVKNGC